MQRKEKKFGKEVSGRGWEKYASVHQRSLGKKKNLRETLWRKRQRARAVILTPAGRRQVWQAFEKLPVICVQNWAKYIAGRGTLLRRINSRLNARQRIIETRYTYNASHARKVDLLDTFRYAVNANFRNVLLVCVRAHVYTCTYEWVWERRLRRTVFFASRHISSSALQLGAISL